MAARRASDSTPVPRNDLTGPDAKPSAVDEVELPVDLARGIVALAELTQRQQFETVRRGKAAATRLGWKEIPPDGPGAR